MRSNKNILFFLIVFFQVVSCSDKSDPGKTVATVGNYAISFEQLDLSFKLNPMYAIRTPYRIARKSQLNFLIENKYYLLAAKKVNLQDDPLVQQRMKYISDQEIIKAHLRESFYNRVKLSAADQKTALNKWSQKRHVYFLHANTRAAADSLLRVLGQGKEIDLLAAQLQTTGISGGEMGEITFGDLDEKMEAAIYNLQLGQFSDVLELPAGYFIFQVTDITQNTDILDMDLNSRLNYVSRILHNRIMDKQIRDHLRTLSSNRKIKVNNYLVDLLLQAVSRATAENTDQQNIFSPQIRTADLEQIQLDIRDFSTEIIAQFGETNLSLRGFLLRLKGMPPLHRPNLSTRNRLIQSIIDLVRDDLLLKDARREGIHELKSVQEKIAENRNEYLASEIQQRMASPDFHRENPQLWQQYKDTFTEVKKNTPVQISEQNLFFDISNPDSVMAPPPVMLFMRDRYIW